MKHVCMLIDGHIIEVGEDMKMVIKRFLASGMTMEEVSVKMDASVEDLTKLLNTYQFDNLPPAGLEIKKLFDLEYKF